MSHPRTRRATTCWWPPRCSLASPTRPEGPCEHRVLGELGPEAAARAYEALLRGRVAPAEEGGLPALDVALLGLGEDGHTASLFPGFPEVDDDSGALCLPVRDAPKPPPERVTLSLPVLRAARCSLLLVTGAGKAPALAVRVGRDPTPGCPRACSPPSACWSWLTRPPRALPDVRNGGGDQSRDPG